MRFLRLTALPFLLWPLAAATSAHAAADITVVVDMTPEGHKVAHPTAAQPAYYLPTIRGYQEFGDVSADFKPPSAHDIVKIIAPELAKQGYRAVDAAHPQASLILDIGWGYITMADDGNARNETQRISLAAGRTYLDIVMPEAYGHDGFMEAIRDNRYFIVVTAYDFSAWEKEHKHVLLWKAKMSVPMDGTTLNDAVVPLVMAGGPQFGRETVRHPILRPGVPDGYVKLGTPTEVKEGAPVPPPPAPATAPSPAPPPSPK